MPIEPPSQSKAAITGRERRAQLKSEQERQTAERTTRPTPPPLAPTARTAVLEAPVPVPVPLRVPAAAAVAGLPGRSSRSSPGTRSSRSTRCPTATGPATSPGTTYLLVGSDSRADLSAEERKELNTGGAAGQRADTIMLLHTGSGPNLLMSIPRDSLVPIPGHGTTKINAAYAFGGPKLLVRTIEANTGIRIDTTSRSGSAASSAWSTPSAASRSVPRRTWSTPTPTCASRRAARTSTARSPWPTRARATPSSSATSTAPPTSARSSSAVGKKAVSPWSVVNPFRYWNLNMAAADFVAIDDEIGPVAAAQFAIGDDAARRRRRPDLRRADLRPRRALGRRRAPSRCSSASSRTTPPASARTSAPPPA